MENTTIKNIDDSVVVTNKTEEQLRELIDQLFIRVAYLEARVTDLEK